MPEPTLADPDGVYRFGPDEFNLMIKLTSLISHDSAWTGEVQRLIAKCREVEAAHHGGSCEVAFDRNRDESPRATASPPPPPEDPTPQRRWVPPGRSI